MTGRDLIIYILENNLENKPVFENGRVPGFLTVKEASVKFEVGEATVRTWISRGLLDGIRIGSEIYISQKEVESFKEDWMDRMSIKPSLIK